MCVHVCVYVCIIMSTYICLYYFIGIHVGRGDVYCCFPLSEITPFKFLDNAALGLLPRVMYHLPAATCNINLVLRF